MRYHLLASALGVALLVSACGEPDNNIEADLNLDRSTAGFIARFSPGDGIIPFPSNLLFKGTSDGTLNIPVADANDLSDPKVALNSLDGFSTIAPITTTFNRTLEPTSFNGDTVQLYKVVLNQSGAVTQVLRKLTYGLEYVASVSPVDETGGTLVISPLRPLDPESNYLVALTNGIQSSDGRYSNPEATYFITKRRAPLVDEGLKSVLPTLTDIEANALEPLRQLVNSQEAALAGEGVASDIIILSWTFSTQSIGNVLDAAKKNLAAVPSATIDGGTNYGGGPRPADIFTGELNIPYYLTRAANQYDTAPLTKAWAGTVHPKFGTTTLSRYNPTPLATSTETIPLLISAPAAPAVKPVSGWPVVIFQHGITQNRSNMLAVADGLAQAGFAVLAIDLPLHGISPGAPFYSAGKERTFDLDLVDNLTSAPGPDGTADPSGTHYINLANLQVTRDNLRQGVADLFALYAAIPDIDYDGGGADLDPNNVYLLGHSLGAIVGAVFAALEPGVKDLTLAMPGSGIAKLLDGSAEFGPLIAAGLGAKGVEKGTADYEAFMAAAQTLIDSGDPANYAALTAQGRGVLLYEVSGDGGLNPPDQVIPNNVLADAPEGTVPAPLAGTTPYAALLGLTPTAASANGADLHSWVRFTAGDHRSLLDPGLPYNPDSTCIYCNLLTTQLMQEMAAYFFGSGGSSVVISDASVIEPLGPLFGAVE